MSIPRPLVRREGAGGIAARDKIADLGVTVLHEHGMQPVATARTVHKGGLVTDGPFLESKEVIAGFFVIEAKDVDEAIAVAKLLPIMDGAVEVRPLFTG